MVHLCVLEMCEELRWVELWVSKSMEIRRAALSAKVLMGKRSNSFDQVGWKASHACASLKHEGSYSGCAFYAAAAPDFQDLLHFTVCPDSPIVFVF